ncbi:MAG TPA: hypothetical protein VM534_02805, partial [Thermoanaerobaculia bacterium]|nr:hypothetical protein [Thermoanaerobaculia bacterium]
GFDQFGQHLCDAFEKGLACHPQLRGVIRFNSRDTSSTAPLSVAEARARVCKTALSGEATGAFPEPEPEPEPGF